MVLPLCDISVPVGAADPTMLNAASTVFQQGRSVFYPAFAGSWSQNYSALGAPTMQSVCRVSDHWCDRSINQSIDFPQRATRAGSPMVVELLLGLKTRNPASNGSIGVSFHCREHGIRQNVVRRRIFVRATSTVVSMISLLRTSICSIISGIYPPTTVCEIAHG